MFGGSYQLPTTAERGYQIVEHKTAKQRSAVVRTWKESPNIWLTVAKNAFVGLAPSLNFRVRVLLKGAIKAVSVVR